MKIDDINGIGTRIKDRRKGLSLTISEMSSYTGLSCGYLSNIERNQTSPTLANLNTICEVLGTTLSDMIRTESDEKVVVRKEERFVRRYRNGSEIIEVIDFGKGGDLYEYSTILPGAEPGLVSKHPYDEIGTVLSGSLVVNIDGVRHELHENDSIYIRARCLHSTENEGDVPSVSFWHYRRDDQ